MDHKANSPERIGEIEDELRRLTQAFRQLELQAAQRDTQLEELASGVKALTGSAEWKIASRLGRLVRALAPTGSRRRAVLKRCVRLTKVKFPRSVLPSFAINKRALSIPSSSDPQPPNAMREMEVTARRSLVLHSAHEACDRAPRSRPTAQGKSGSILIIDHRLPSPDRDCGSLRMVEIIRVLLERGHTVTFIPDNFLAWSPYFEDLRQLGVDVVHPPGFETVAGYLRVHGREVDLALISRAGIAAKHLGTVRWLAPQARIVFDTVDLHFVREERAAELVGDADLKLAAKRRRDQELGLASRSDLTLVVSQVERAILQRECPGLDVMVIPTIYPVDPVQPPGFDGRRDIVFIGGFDHAPNVDAVLYFASEILPRLAERFPEIVFRVIGSQPPDEIVALHGPRVEILGHVPDVKPIFDRAIASVAPLRFGAGVKGKINHSMALGVPVVATALAVEGMYLEHDQSVLIADDPEEFSEALARVCRSRDLWERLSWNGRESLQAHFSVQAATRSIDAMLAWAGLKEESTESRPHGIRVG